jgi:AcrR family transcriptional regulator
MPRPKTVEDGQVLEATHRTISRLGPARFTLADVAREAGLSAATLVQRFGSKRGLLLALAKAAVGSMDACFAMVRGQHRSPLAALLSAATEMTRHTKSPEEMANHLAYLQIDLSDAEFRALFVKSSDLILAGYRALLDEAVGAGELLPCDTARLARAVSALSGGSLISWAAYHRGSAETWVLYDLTTLLEPYRSSTGRRLESRGHGARTKRRSSGGPTR